MPEDYPTMLNNLLQKHSSGNLATFLKYDFKQEGPSDRTVHTATAMFCGVPYGVGTGTSKGAARMIAAKATFEAFTRNGVPET